MPILTKEDILAAQQQGLIEIKDLTGLNATSLDVRIDKLLTPAVERKDMKEVPLIDGEYWLPKPEDFFLYETVELFTLAPSFHGHIHSRSSWARFGSASRDVHDEFSLPADRTFSGKVICSLTTLGTTIMIRPGDAIAQAHLAYDGFTPLTDNELEYAIKNGLLNITRDGRRIEDLVQTFSKDGTVGIGSHLAGQKMNGGFTLTTDPVIKVYTGKVIDPHSPDPGCFEERLLPPEGLLIPKGSFFLSASAETVKIDARYVGWVGEWNHLLVTSGYHGPGIHSEERMSSLQTHAAAPKIDPFPRFHGKITFENLALTDMVVRPGDRLAEFYLYHLHSPYLPEEKEVSRYNGQSEATGSRAHLDQTGAQRKK
jgi:deoxycytidine triphosphate deaminase